MKKLQISKLNIKDSHGITLMSLIIYLTIMFVVLALIMRVTTYFTKNIDDVADVTFETEFEKFNLYILEETKKSENGVCIVKTNKIIFADGNIIEFVKEEGEETGEIYFNGTKLCENVNTCTFSMTDSEETNKITVNVNITINGVTKEEKYITVRKKIPNAYQEVEWIENTSNSYINTGLVGKPGYTIETELSYAQLATGTYQYFAGYAYTGSSDRVYFIRMNNNSKHLGYTYGSDNSNTTNLSLLNANTFYKIKSVMKSGEQELFLNDESIGTSSFDALSYDENNSKYIYMFISQYINTINGPAYVKCKYAKWYDENDNLVREYIPCYRKSDNEIGMYDIVNGVFYTNDNEEADRFTKGKDIKEDNMVKEKNYLISDRLPEAYKEVEYIESTGTQYINTGIIPSNDLTTDIVYVDTSANDSNYVLGSRNTSSSTINYAIGGSYSNLKITAYFNGNTWTHDIVRVANVKYNIKLSIEYDSELGYRIYSQCKDKTNNTLYTGYTPYSTNGVAGNSSEIYVFAFNSSNIHKGMKVYSLKFWKGDTLSGNFIPCYRISDGEIGLYDTISEEFYTNQGTGTFEKGLDVY